MNEQPSLRHRILPNELPPPCLKPAEDKSRLGVVSLLYHQQAGAEPVAVEARYSRWLESNEQPYLRKLLAGERWSNLDRGWLERASMLFLKNEEGRFQVQPTEEERLDVMGRVIEIGWTPDPDQPDLANPIALVRPLESLQLEPADLLGLCLRAWHGKARCTLLLLPS